MRRVWSFLLEKINPPKPLTDCEQQEMELKVNRRLQGLKMALQGVLPTVPVLKWFVDGHSVSFGCSREEGSPVVSQVVQYVPDKALSAVSAMRYRFISMRAYCFGPELQFPPLEMLGYLRDALWFGSNQRVSACVAELLRLSRCTLFDADFRASVYRIDGSAWGKSGELQDLLSQVRRNPLKCKEDYLRDRVRYSGDLWECWSLTILVVQSIIETYLQFHDDGVPVQEGTTAGRGNLIIGDERYGPYVVAKRGIVGRFVRSWFGLLLLVVALWCSFVAVCQKEHFPAGVGSSMSGSAGTGFGSSLDLVWSGSSALNVSACPISPPIALLSVEQSRCSESAADAPVLMATGVVAVSLVKAPAPTGVSLPPDFVRGMAFSFVGRYAYGRAGVPATQLDLRLDCGVLHSRALGGLGGKRFLDWSILSLAIHFDESKRIMDWSAIASTPRTTPWRNTALRYQGSLLWRVRLDWWLWLLMGFWWLVVEEGHLWRREGGVRLEPEDDGLDHPDPEEPEDPAPDPPRRRRKQRQKPVQGNQGRTRPYLHRKGKERPRPRRTRPYLARAAKKRPAGAAENQPP